MSQYNEITHIISWVVYLYATQVTCPFGKGGIPSKGVMDPQKKGTHPKRITNITYSNIQNYHKGGTFHKWPHENIAIILTPFPH